MPRVLAYHRPADIAGALDLLADGTRVPLAGGSDLVGRLNTGHLSGIEVVDLQDVGLADVSSADGRVSVGAMVSLQGLADAAEAPEFLRELARTEQPSTLRTRATIGGVVAGRDAESVLLAGLLAAEASVVLVGADSETTRGLGDVLAAGVPTGALITAVTLASDGVWATSATRRTPADVPIVAAVARRSADGDVTVALTGVAATPVVVDPADPVAGLQPTGDFRGSPDYRRHLAGVHCARVLDALTEN